MRDCHSIVGLYTYQNRVPFAPSLRWVSCKERDRLPHEGANFHSSFVHYRKFKTVDYEATLNLTVDVLPGMNAGASTSAVPSPIEGSGTAWVLLGSWALSPARPTPIPPRHECRGFSALLVTMSQRNNTLNMWFVLNHGFLATFGDIPL